MNLKFAYFITIEGGEGSGKSTVIKAIQQFLASQGYEVVTTREPGGIRIAEQIREVILNKENTEMDALTEASLYAAARRQHIVEKVKPALDKGKIVLCDRFVDSSLAYQGYARGIGMDTIWKLNQPMIEDCIPDLTIVLDVEPEVGLKRIFTNNRNTNRLDLEGIDFHRRVREGYHILAEKFPERIVLMDANGETPIVLNQVYKLLEKKLEERRKRYEDL